MSRAGSGRDQELISGCSPLCPEVPLPSTPWPGALPRDTFPGSHGGCGETLDVQRSSSLALCLPFPLPRLARGE